MFRAPVWPRPRFEPTGEVARCSFLVFSTEPFPADGDGTWPMDRPDWCPYDEWPEGFRWGHRTREKSPAQFAGMEEAARASLQSQATGMTPALLETVAACRFGANVECAFVDPPDLGYLQFAWAIVRWLIHSAPSVVLDIEVGRWTGGDAIRDWHAPGWPDGRRFALDREMAQNTFAIPGEPWWSLNTAGLSKFGRRDLLLLVPGEGETDLDAEVRHATIPGWAPEALSHFANRLALGEGLGPGKTIDFGTLHFVAEACEPGRNAPADVGRDYLVLVNQAPGQAYRPA